MNDTGTAHVVGVELVTGGVGGPLYNAAAYEFDDCMVAPKDYI